MLTRFFRWLDRRYRHPHPSGNPELAELRFNLWDPLFWVWYKTLPYRKEW